ncbi:MAG: Glu/Leu/Phe/Val dehydrogenase dimerization domain-containing protein [Lysobacterales bacterium]
MAFDHPEFDGHEEVVWFHDAASGLKAITALHRVRGKAALGGIRFLPYPNENAALTDVLRLSRAMSYKWALTGLGFGGGKSVVIADPATKTPELLRSVGRCIETLGGRYLGAPDVGSSASDMTFVRETTAYVAGLPGSDTAVPTAKGLFHAIEAMARAKLGVSDLTGVCVAVQGAGGVGGRLCHHLAEAGAAVKVADTDASVCAAVVQSTGAEMVDVDQIQRTPADIFSPCALGAVLSQHTIPSLGAQLICGAANNQLAEVDDADRLTAAGITWAPDYVVSAGGILGGAREIGEITEAECEQRLLDIGGTLMKVLDKAEAGSLNTDQAAKAMALEMLGE